MASRTAHMAHPRLTLGTNRLPDLPATACGEPWEDWQHPDQGATDDEVRVIFAAHHPDNPELGRIRAARELQRIKDEERAREDREGTSVRQCQACLRAAMRLA